VVRLGSNPGTPGGEIFATLLHLSGSIERLVWGSQIEKSKVSNQPSGAIQHGKRHRAGQRLFEA
jgi:hypothetical protein